MSSGLLNTSKNSRVSKQVTETFVEEQLEKNITPKVSVGQSADRGGIRAVFDLISQFVTVGGDFA